MLAVNSCNAEAVRIVLEAGESLDSGESDDDTSPLGQACFLGQEEIVELLLEKSIEIEPVKGCSCVHWLCQSKSPRIAKLMLMKDIDVSRVDHDGFVGPHYLVDSAPDQEAIEILQLLVEYMWDVNQPYGPHQSTLLGEYLESILRPMAVIRWLIEHGADLQAPAWNGIKQSLMHSEHDRDCIFLPKESAICLISQKRTHHKLSTTFKSLKVDLYLDFSFTMARFSLFSQSLGEPLIFVTRSAHESVCIWRISDIALMKRLGGHTCGVTAIAVSPTGKFIVSTWISCAGITHGPEMIGVVPAILCFSDEFETDYRCFVSSMKSGNGRKC
jgi:hypothetical protein